MATKTFVITGSQSDLNTTKTLSGTLNLPDATSIISVTTTPTVDASKIQYQLDDGLLNVTLNDVKSSGTTSTYLPGSLTSWGINPDGTRDCKYSNGTFLVSSGACPTANNISVTRYKYEYTVNVEYETNRAPSVTLATTDARTLYESDTIGITGNVQDADVGNVMTVKYTINGGTTRAIHTSISDGSQVPFNRTLTFRNKRLYDGQTAVTGDLQEGAQNTIRVWAEDDQGGRSEDVYRSFQVVPNRPATLTINPVEQQDSLIDSDSITISGSVNDPDGNTVTVEYRLFGESFEQVYNGAGGNFSFNVQLSRLNTGDNNITIRATDSYGATTTRTLKVTKAGAVTPLKRSIATYRINPTNGTAQGVVLWIQRDSGDLDVTLEISATAEGEEEVWEPMTLDSTAFVEDGIEEDEWIYEAAEPKEKILLRMTLERENTNSTAGVRLISGVLS